jgi:hypothetical protein
MYKITIDLSDWGFNDETMTIETNDFEKIEIIREFIEFQKENGWAADYEQVSIDDEDEEYFYDEENDMWYWYDADADEWLEVTLEEEEEEEEEEELVEEDEAVTVSTYVITRIEE